MRPRQRATELLLRPRRSLHLPCVRVRDDPGSSPGQAGGAGRAHDDGGAGKATGWKHRWGPKPPPMYTYDSRKPDEHRLNAHGRMEVTGKGHR